MSLNIIDLIEATVFAVEQGNYGIFGQPSMEIVLNRSPRWALLQLANEQAKVSDQLAMLKSYCAEQKGVGTKASGCQMLAKALAKQTQSSAIHKQWDTLIGMPKRGPISLRGLLPSTFTERNAGVLTMKMLPPKYGHTYSNVLLQRDRQKVADAEVAKLAQARIDAANNVSATSSLTPGNGTNTVMLAVTQQDDEGPGSVMVALRRACFQPHRADRLALAAAVETFLMLRKQPGVITMNDPKNLMQGHFITTRRSRNREQYVAIICTCETNFLSPAFSNSGFAQDAVDKLGHDALLSMFNAFNGAL